MLDSWRDTPARQAIVEFVQRVTREDSEEFVPVGERVAVFDNDGTLWCEATSRCCATRAGRPDLACAC